MDSAPSHRLEYDSRTDVELWTALCSGETVALGHLYDRHAGLVYGVSLNMLGNAQEAEDLTQDIFVKLVERKNFDPARGSLRTFLMMLTRSRATDRLRSRQSARRSQQRLRANYLTSSLANVDPAAQNVIESEQSETVRSALSRLSAEQRQALHLAYFEGFTQSDIASHLDTPLGTIKARTRRGLLKLREILIVQKETVQEETIQEEIIQEKTVQGKIEP
ncbi:MAG: sigma-70 family RNA polymerase sigma factor [Phormidesmis sp.]